MAKKKSKGTLKDKYLVLFMEGSEHGSLVNNNFPDVGRQIEFDGGDVQVFDTYAEAKEAIVDGFHDVEGTEYVCRNVIVKVVGAVEVSLKKEVRDA
jgi:hypothetical protein